MSVCLTDSEERVAGESQAGPALSQPHDPTSLFLFRNVFPSPPLLTPLASSFLWVTSGSCWGHPVSASLWAVSSPPRYFSHSPSGLGAKTLVFPACLMVQGCSAGHQRVAKLVSFLVCGEGLLPGLGSVRNSRWDRDKGDKGTGAPGPIAPRPLPASQPLT